MNLKILWVILIYYGVLSLFFITGSSIYANYSSGINLNSSELTSSEVDKGGLFGTGVDFGRFASLITVGIGLPDDTPNWFKVIFSMWQIIFLIFVIGWFISSIWNG